MKRNSIICILLFLFLLVTAVNIIAQEVFTQENNVLKSISRTALSLTGMEYLDFTTFLGKVTVKTAENKPASLEMVKFYYGDDFSEGKQILQNIKTVTESAGKSLKIITQTHTRAVSGIDIEISLYLPARIDLSIETQSGDINLPDIGGNVHLFTGAGNITSGSINGSLVIESLGGYINVKNVVKNAEISTKGGSISIEDVGEDLRLRTSGGFVNAGNIGGTVNISSGGGPVKIRSSGSGVFGSTLGGNVQIGISNGPVEFITSAGTIKADTVKGYVDVKTTGGSIELGNISGFIDAETNGGEITADVSDKFSYPDRHINMFSSGGDITVRIPESLPADISARIDISGNFNNNYKIISDIPLRRKSDNANKITSPVYSPVIQGWVTLNNGGNPVNLKAVNGNIIIKTY